MSLFNAPKKIKITNITEEDWKLIQQFRDTNELVYCWLLFQKYKKLLKTTVFRIIRTFRFSPLTMDDYEHLIFLSIVKSMEAFELNNEKYNWQQFIITRLRSEVLAYAKRYISKKHQVLNNSITLDEKIKWLEQANRGNNPQSVLDVKEQYGKITKLKLSKLEKEILELRKQEMSISEIAIQLQVEYKSVDNTLQRIAKKLKNIK